MPKTYRLEDVIEELKLNRVQNDARNEELVLDFKKKRLILFKDGKKATLVSYVLAQDEKKGSLSYVTKSGATGMFIGDHYNLDKLLTMYDIVKD